MRSLGILNLDNFLKRYAVELFLCLILIFAFLVGFYNLGSVPNGLNKDETAIGYNAYSIGQTGRDEYGTFLPLYFRSFNDYKLPVYVYLTTVSEKIFGVNAFAVRFPSMLFGVLTVLFIFILIKQISNRSDLALVASFLLAVNPWHIFFSHAGFEVNVATALAVLGTLFFVVGIKRKINYLWLIFSIFSFTLSIYCYNVARIVSLLILCGLVVINFKKISEIPKYILAVFALLIIGSLTPFFFTLFYHSGLSNQIGDFIIGVVQQSKNLEIRSYFFSFPALFTKLFFNNWLLISLQYLRNVFGFFSFDFFFINGAPNPIDGVGNFGMFYFLELPFIFIGLILGIKKRVAYLLPFYFWLIIVILASSLTLEVPQATRSYMAIIPMIIFSAYGCLAIVDYLRLQKKIITYPLVGIYSVLFVYLIFYFLSIYFVYFPIRYAKYWRAEDKNIVAFIQSRKMQYQKIIFDKKVDFAYTSLLFYLKYSPADYQKNAIYQKDGLLNSLRQVNEFEFKDVDWHKDYDTGEKTLFIVDPSNTDGKGILKTFYLPERPVVNVPNGTIVTYPYAEPIYSLVENNQ